MFVLKRTEPKLVIQPLISPSKLCSLGGKDFLISGSSTTTVAMTQLLNDNAITSEKKRASVDERAKSRPQRMRVPSRKRKSAQRSDSKAKPKPKPKHKAPNKASSKPKQSSKLKGGQQKQTQNNTNRKGQTQINNNNNNNNNNKQINNPLKAEGAAAKASLRAESGTTGNKNNRLLFTATPRSLSDNSGLYMDHSLLYPGSGGYFGDDRDGGSSPSTSDSTSMPGQGRQSKRLSFGSMMRKRAKYSMTSRQKSRRVVRPEVRQRRKLSAGSKVLDFASYASDDSSHIKLLMRKLELHAGKEATASNTKLASHDGTRGPPLLPIDGTLHHLPPAHTQRKQSIGQGSHSGGMSSVDENECESKSLSMSTKVDGNAGFGVFAPGADASVSASVSAETCPSCGARFSSKQAVISHLRDNVQCYLKTFENNNNTSNNKN